MSFTPTRWRPNTCDCELMQHEFSADMVKPCKDHKEDTGQVPFDENQGLNRTLNILEGRGLKNVKWEFEKVGRGRRKLKIYISPGIGVVFDPRDANFVEINHT